MRIAAAQTGLFCQHKKSPKRSHASLFLDGNLSHLGRNLDIFQGNVRQFQHTISMLNESLWVPREEKLSIWGAVVSTILEKLCFLWPWVTTPRIARPHSPFRMSLHLSCLPQLLHHVLIITLLIINQSHLTQWAKCVCWKSLSFLRKSSEVVYRAW